MHKTTAFTAGSRRRYSPPQPGLSLLTVQGWGWGGLVYCDRAKKAQVSAVPCCPGRCLPPGAPSLLRWDPRRRLKLRLRHPPGSSRPAALSSVLPWPTLFVFGYLRSKKASAINAARAELLCLGSKYPKRPMYDAAPPRGGLDLEWWSVGTGKLFQDAPTSCISSQYHMGGSGVQRHALQEQSRCWWRINKRGKRRASN